ncbi:MAG TPA: MerR family transcriptional regulator [Candidatus Limnocylindrales bacterium]
MVHDPTHDQDDATTRIGPAGAAIGQSPRMLRYLEDQGVIVAERRPGPRGHRHYPPPEVALGRAASASMEAGHPTATLRALRALAERRVGDARASGDPLAWFELLALARAVEVSRRQDEAPARPPGPPGISRPPRGP